MGVQSYSLASYPAIYQDTDALYSLVLLYGFPLSLWLYILYNDEKLPWLFVVWLLYVIEGLNGVVAFTVNG